MKVGNEINDSLSSLSSTCLTPMAFADDGKRRNSNSESYGVFSVAGSEKSLWAQVTSDNWSYRIKDYLRLIFITLPPICVVITLCGLSLQSGKVSIDNQKSLQENLNESQTIGILVNNLAKERGFTCLYLSITSESDKNLSLSKLLNLRSDTDHALDLVTHFLTPGDSNRANFGNKEEFRNFLIDFRSLIDNKTFPICDEVIAWYTNFLRWYTDKINTFMEQMSQAFRQTNDGQFWTSMDSYREILTVKDLIGLQRALGSSFFATGQFSQEDFSKFSRYFGATEKILNVSLYKSPKAKNEFATLREKNLYIINHLETFYEIIFQNGAIIPNYSQFMDWFDVMAAYLQIFDDVQSAIIECLYDDMRKNVNNFSANFNISLAVIVVVLILSPSSTIWYALRSKKLIKKVNHFATQVTFRNKELVMERKKTELLLFQILPKSVALELKLNKLVAPENFESATIYFSDIQGFTTLSSKCKPLEIVHLLNQLYTKFDEVLDQYDVYKVETIGDAYVVVSGVPQRNGCQHSAQICTMALHLLQNIASVPVPYHDGEQLLMRIGVHTGSCAAGVVGTKMPRYCLFGMNVNIANTIESKGTALCVHLSSTTAEHLKQNHPGEFLIESNGSIYVKQFGIMETFWLLEKRNFPFKVDRQEALDIIAGTNYWH